MMDPLSTPNLYAEVRDLRRRLEFLERAPRYTSQVVTAVPLGAVRDFGFSTFDATTFSDLFRADVPVTAPLLDYDLQLTDFWATSPPASIEWQITAKVENVGAITVVASGSGAGGDQFRASVDLIPLLGPDIIGKVVRFDLEAKRTGGSGDIGLRQVRPMYLRTPASS